MYPLPVYNGNTRSRKSGPPSSFTQGQSNQPSLLFDAMSGTLVLGRGGQAPTFIRATVATITDQDLVVRQVLSGEARFGGFRRVQNLLTNTENWASAAWTTIAGGTGTVPTKTANFGVAPDGTTTAARIQATIAAGTTAADFSLIRQATSAITTRASTMWMKSNTAATQQVFGFGFGGTAVMAVTTSWQRFSAPADNTTFDFGCKGSTSADKTLDILVWHPQDEEVVGQSNQNPAEYVSVGVLSAPYQGANVDGVRYFPYLNGNTVASNVVTEATGAAISSSILGGYLPEPAATDLLTARADARDMTTANWVGGATIIRSRTATGADGVANKATILQAGAVAATNTVLTTITAAASTRTYSVLLKRGSGTGPVRITQDGFATSTDVSGLINSTTFTLVQIVQSQLNAQIGIKVDTNGDTVIADWNQFSAGDLTGLINSRIPDTITTRNADVLTYATTGWLNAAAGTLYAEWFNPNLSQTIKIASLNDGSGANLINAVAQTITTARTLVLVGAATQSDLSAVTITGAAVAKMVTIYQLNDFAGYANNTTLGTDAAGTIPALTRIEIGEENGSGHTGHYIRKVAYYPTRMTNESAKALTV